MKEKLIVFTRDRKNIVNLIMADIIIFGICTAIMLLFSGIPYIAIRIIIGASAIIPLIGSYWVFRLFYIDENVIRNNKMAIIFMAYSDIVYWILFIIWAVIALKLKTVRMIIIISILAIVMIISYCITKYFSKKIKY